MNTNSLGANNHGFETRSLPHSLAATHRGFTFYVADPFISIRGWHGLVRMSPQILHEVPSECEVSSHRFQSIVRLPPRSGNHGLLGFQKRLDAISRFTVKGVPPLLRVHSDQRLHW
jgi:hypothetical protein